MVIESGAPRASSLGAGEADLAGHAVFTWGLLPAAARMVHEAAAGGISPTAVHELRSAVRLLDHLGWPDDPSEATELDPEETAMVQRAALTHVGRGLVPDARIARGPALHAASRAEPVDRLLRSPG
jgi:hypothetical protein